MGEGDLVLGALGHRAATLEVVGSWENVGEDGVMEALTGAGLMGLSTSRSDLIPDLVRLVYRGHFRIDSNVVRMDDFVPEPLDREFRTPVVLIIGSSMSAGKTTTGRAIVRALRRQGRRVVAAKLTGAARFRDLLTLGDAGAEWIFDFVDAGLPSSVCPPEEYRERITGLLARMAAVPADTAVIEAGASPLEPYNGAEAVRILDPNIRCTVLCASDPYAVVGIIHAFGRRPDLVAGVAATTEAGIALVEKLSGVQAIDARNPRSAEALEQVLARTLDEKSPRRTETR
ncbi:MAG: hypothetical protein JRH16_09155 [Deltaproteobacteria bacterium]|nr:hypothetical protein [Deltaproteobacteria bacterium]MBW2361936.1 hypothetical protein [Deltaproteobacteria bacterium]